MKKRRISKKLLVMGEGFVADSRFFAVGGEEFGEDL